MRKSAHYLLLGLGFSSLLASASPQPPISVFTEKVVPQTIFSVLSFPARVESRVNAIVRSESDGAVTKILKPLGSRVRRGDTVAIVRHTDPVYEFAPLHVLSTVNGVVSEVDVTRGSLVNKGDAIVKVTDPSHLRVMSEVAALDVHSLKSGMTGTLKIPGLEPEIAVTVAGISPSIDPMLGTATCELHMRRPEDAKAVVAGMVGRVQFRLNEHQGFLVPEYALVYSGDKTYLRRVVDGQSRKVEVTLGERRQGQVEILKGLQAGDFIIDRASRFVPEGAAVKQETVHE